MSVHGAALIAPSTCAQRSSRCHPARSTHHAVILRAAPITPSSCAQHTHHAVILRAALITPSSCAQHPSRSHPARSEAKSQDPPRRKRHRRRGSCDFAQDDGGWGRQRDAAAQARPARKKGALPEGPSPRNSPRVTRHGERGSCDFAQDESWGRQRDAAAQARPHERRAPCRAPFSSQVTAGTRPATILSPGSPGRRCATRRARSAAPRAWAWSPGWT